VLLQGILRARSARPLAAATVALALVGAGCADPTTRPIGTGRDFSHDAFFPVNGSHAGLGCYDCHDPNATSFAVANDGVRCTSCHAQDDPLVAAAHTGVTSYDWTNAACVSCHRTAVADFDHEKLFPIGSGTLHAGYACSDCHGATKARAELGCTGCHVGSIPHGDEAACGASHQSVAGYSWSSPQCYACHPQSKLPAFDHALVSTFPLGAGSTHAGLACSDCHGATRATADLRCTTCHAGAMPHADEAATTALHGSLPGYAWNSPACYSCHADGSIPNFDHASVSTFPIGPGATHQGFGCASCHGTTKAALDLQCITCHEGTEPHDSQTVNAAIHGTLPGYAYDSPSCYSCHRDGGIPSFDHTTVATFPIAAGAVHAGIGCAQCHGPTKAVADLRCTSCHTGTRPHDSPVVNGAIHDGMPGYAFDSPTCHGCHADGGIPSFDHTTVSSFHIAAGSAHAGLACATCHGATKASPDLVCTSCHAGSFPHDDATVNANIHGTMPGYAFTPAACFTCHADGQIPAFDHTTVSPFAIGPTSKHAGLLCADCHGTTKAPADLRCLGCHAGSVPHDDQVLIDGLHLGLGGYAYDAATCVGCHTDGGVAPLDHLTVSQFPIASGATHAGIPCASCHGLTRAAADLQCVTCHQGTEPHDDPAINATLHLGVTGYAYDSQSCFSCHADAGIPAFDHLAVSAASNGGVGFPIDATSVHAGIGCASCHGATKAVANLRCTTCHQGTEPHDDVTINAAIHSGLSGYAFDSPTCYSCHADAGIPSFDHLAASATGTGVGFPIGAATVHAGVGCASCHGPTKAVADLRCTSCHLGSFPHDDQTVNAGIHGTMIGYSFSAPVCYGCHQDGGIPPFDHATQTTSSFAMGPATPHAGLLCADCHGATKDVAGLRCISCHAGTLPHDDVTVNTNIHGTMLGYSFDSPTCFSCHQDGGIPPFDHAAQTTSSFAMGAGTMHAGLACSDCHGATKAAADLQCTSCHTVTTTTRTPHSDVSVNLAVHDGIPGYLFDSPTCFSCHQDGGIPPFDHTTVSPFALAAGTTHAGLPCGSCHGLTKHLPDIQCVSCHDGTLPHSDPLVNANIHGTMPGYAFDSPTCVGCHADAGIPNFDHTTVSTFPVGVSSVHAGIACSGCHGATKTTADLQCIGCHVGNQPHADQALTDALHAAVAGYTYDSPSCFACHPTANVPLPPGHDTSSFQITGTPHATAACSQCHGVTKQVTDIGCTASLCHPQAATGTQHAAVPYLSNNGPPQVATPTTTLNYQWSTTFCLRCHPDGTVYPIAGHPYAPPLDLERKIGSEAHPAFCLTCHPYRRTDKPWGALFGSVSLVSYDCSVCHLTNNPGN
jgi:hypothetical protein